MLSTVASTATSKVAFMEAQMQFNQKQMDAQSIYEFTLYFVKKMQQRDLITDLELEKAKSLLQEKYKPVIRH